MQFHFHSAWKVFIGCSTIFFVQSGLLASTTGLYFPSISSDLGIDYNSISVALMFSTITVALSLPLGVMLLERIDVRVLAAIFLLFDATGIYVRAVAQTNAALIVSFILQGIGASLLSGTLQNILLVTWFKKKLGFALGLMTALGGFGGALYSPLVSRLIVSIGWRSTLRYSAFFMLILLLPISSLTLKRRPDLTEGPYGELVESSKQESDGPSFNQFLRKPAFYVLLFALIMMLIPISIQQHLPTHSITKGFSLTNSAILTSAFLLGNGFGKLTIGYLMDTLKPVITLRIFMVLGIAGFVGQMLLRNTYTFAICAALLGMYISTIIVGTPCILLELFGSKAFPRLSAVLGMVSTIALAGVNLWVGASFVKNGNYDQVMLVFVSAIFVGVLLVTYIYLKQDKLLSSKLERGSQITLPN